MSVTGQGRKEGRTLESEEMSGRDQKGEKQRRTEEEVAVEHDGSGGWTMSRRLREAHPEDTHRTEQD